MHFRISRLSALIPIRLFAACDNEKHLPFGNRWWKSISRWSCRPQQMQAASAFTLRRKVLMVLRRATASIAWQDRQSARRLLNADNGLVRLQLEQCFFFIQNAYFQNSRGETFTSPLPNQHSRTHWDILTEYRAFGLNWMVLMVMDEWLQRVFVSFSEVISHPPLLFIYQNPECLSTNIFI